jgi:hypothetical protein
MPRPFGPDQGRLYYSFGIGGGGYVQAAAETTDGIRVSFSPDEGALKTRLSYFNPSPSSDPSLFPLVLISVALSRALLWHRRRSRRTLNVTAKPLRRKQLVSLS